MRILHAITPGIVGGLESVVLALAGGQAARGHEVSVAAVVDREPDPHPLLISLERAGVAVDRIPARGRRYLMERRTIGTTIAARRAEVVHTHGYRSDVLAGSAARRLEIPTITTVHGFTGGDRKNRFYEAIQVASFRSFDAVVAVSSPLKRALVHRGVPAERIQLLPNAWAGVEALPAGEARARLGLPAGDFIAGWVGRMSREKGLDVFLDALANPAAAGVTAAILGEGRDRRKLESRAERLGLSDRLHWCGLVPDAGRYMTAFDAFVLSSRTEGTPITLFEAMDAGVPVVATGVGGVPDVLSPEEGIILGPESPPALARAIAQVRSDPQAAGRRADRARIRLDRDFSLSHWLDAHDALYSRLTCYSGPS